MSLKFWFSVSEEEKDLLVFQKKSPKMLINHQNLRKHYNQCVGQFCYVWMFWAVAGLSCSYIIKINSRLSSLLARRGKKPIICFSPGAWACRRVKLWGNLLRPPRDFWCSGQAQDSFLPVPGPEHPRPHSWQLSQAPNLWWGRHSLPMTSSEAIPSSWQNFPPWILYQQRPLWQTERGHITVSVHWLWVKMETLVWGRNHPQKQFGAEQLLK